MWVDTFGGSYSPDPPTRRYLRSSLIQPSRFGLMTGQRAEGQRAEANGWKRDQPYIQYNYS